MEITSRSHALAKRLADRGDRWDSLAPVEESYLDAVKRIEDHTADPENPYYLAPHDEAQFVPGVGICVGPDGTEMTAAEVEEWAVWPLSWRPEKDMFERVCEHGIGHPDPDSLRRLPEGSGVHGCDGCCRTPNDDERNNG